MEAHFIENKCSLTSEGTLTAAEIRDKGIIDMHYAALARNAMELDPPTRDLSPKTAADFEAAFGRPYGDGSCVETLGQLLKRRPELTAAQIDAAWNASPKVKLGGGLYVGRLAPLEASDALRGPKAEPLLVINGFYASMRADYVEDGNQVVYFTVEWREKDLSWAEFRQNVVGATDPAKAVPTSLRAKLLRAYKELGISALPSIQNNCIHASAGPIEAMRERSVWVGMPLNDDPFAQVLVNHNGIPFSLVQSWANNDIVSFEDRSGPAFDVFEDVDSSKVVEMAKAVVSKRAAAAAAAAAAASSPSP